MNDKKNWLEELKVGDEVIVWEGVYGYQHIGIVDSSSDGIICVYTTHSQYPKLRFFHNDGALLMPGRFDCGTHLLEATPEAKAPIIHEKLRSRIYNTLGPSEGKKVPLPTLQQIEALLQEAQQ